MAVVAAAFVVRALALLAADDARLVLDEQHYRLRAEALLDGQGFVGSYQSWVRHEGRPIDLPQYPGAWQPPGQTPAELLYQGDHKFCMSQRPQVSLVFEVSEGRAVGLTLNQGSQAFEAVRTD